MNWNDRLGVGNRRRSPRAVMHGAMCFSNCR